MNHAVTPQVIYLPDRVTWILARGNDYAEIDTEDISRFLGLFRLTVLTAADLNEMPVVDKHVRVREWQPPQCVIEVVARGGQVLDVLTVRGTDIPVHDAVWTAGAFDDGWISTHATLQLRNVKALAFELYLPASEDLGEKTFIARLAEAEVLHCVVPRGDLFVTPTIELGSRACFLQVGAAYPEIVPTDKRTLGFVVPHVRLEGEVVTPFKRGMHG
jgi:hypothetical protein